MCCPVVVMRFHLDRWIFTLLNRRDVWMLCIGSLTEDKRKLLTECNDVSKIYTTNIFKYLFFILKQYLFLVFFTKISNLLALLANIFYTLNLILF